MEELDARNLSSEIINEIALEVNAAIAYELIINENVTKEKISMHVSNFLDKEEIREIYIEQLEKYIKYKDQFRFDVWSYSIAGI